MYALDEIKQMHTMNRIIIQFPITSITTIGWVMDIIAGVLSWCQSQVEELETVSISKIISGSFIYMANSHVQWLGAWLGQCCHNVGDFCKPVRWINFCERFWWWTLQESNLWFFLWLLIQHLFVWQCSISEKGMKWGVKVTLKLVSKVKLGFLKIQLYSPALE